MSRYTRRFDYLCPWVLGIRVVVVVVVVATERRIDPSACGGGVVRALCCLLTLKGRKERKKEMSLVPRDTSVCVYAVYLDGSTANLHPNDCDSIDISFFFFFYQEKKKIRFPANCDSLFFADHFTCC